MPNPSFEPIIGSSFDALAGQRAGWAGFNARIDEGNIARLNQAEQTQNDWLRQVAALQQAAQNRDLALAQSADETRRAAMMRREDIALAERQRAQDLGLSKERLAAENRRTDKMGEVQRTALALKQAQAEQAIEQHGQSHASNYLLAKNNAKATNDVFDKLQEDIKDLEEKRQELLLKPKKTQVEQLQLNDYATKIKTLAAQVPNVRRAADRAENDFQNLRNRIQNQGFDIRDDKIVHAPTGKEWTFKAVLQDAKDNLSLPGEAPDDGGDPTASEDWASAYGTGITSGTGTSAPTVAPPVAPSTGTNTFNVGRFRLTTQ